MKSKHKMYASLIAMFIVLSIGAICSGRLMKADKHFSAHVLTFGYAVVVGSLATVATSNAFKDDGYDD